MRRRSGASSKLAKARSHKAKTLKPVRHSSSSASGQETEVVRLTRELNEARELHAATAEVLRVISISPHNIQPVFARRRDDSSKGRGFCSCRSTISLCQRLGGLSKVFNEKLRNRAQGLVFSAS